MKRGRWARWRDRLRDRPDAEFGYRIVVAVIGLVVLAVGILAIPYPGPGWAIVFVGLAILATEFDWARRLLAYTRERYDKVMAWFKRRVLGAGRWAWPSLPSSCSGPCGYSACSAGPPGSSASNRVAEEPYWPGSMTTRTDSMVAFSADPHTARITESLESHR